MRAPVWSLLLCTSAAIIFFVPALAGVVIYDRDAISGGEWWRLITGNLVHLSPTHFLYDVVSLLVVGAIIELRNDRHLWLLYGVAATVIGLAVYITSPELRFYGGLSGIVSAAMVYLCLDGLSEKGCWRWLYGVVLALAMIKIGIEFAFGQTFLSMTEPQPFIPVPESHLAGACSALSVFMLTRYGSGIRPAFGRGASATANPDRI